MEGLKILKAEEMALRDKKAIEEIGIPSLALMENASSAVASYIEKNYPKEIKVLIVAGKGNNGGDGIAVGRRLHLKGYRVDLFLPLGEPKGDAFIQLKVAKNLSIPILEKEPNYLDYDLIVDAIFGTGFKPPVRGKVKEVIEAINNSSADVISVDIPSGLWADSGEVFEPSVIAKATVTFQFPKICHLLHPSALRCGEVVVADISIPDLSEDPKRYVLSKDHFCLPLRRPDTYKTREGHILIVGGSTGKTGAVILSAMASTRAGAGLVTVGIPEDLNPIFESTLVEEMSWPLPAGDRLSYFAVEEILKNQDRFHALVLGMGMGRYEEGQDIVRDLILGWEKKILLDADAINNLADLGDLSILRDRSIPAVLTPHVGEFSRLTGLETDFIRHHLTDVAQDFATKWNCYLVLKSSRTAVATPEGEVFLSLRGTPAMAKGGAGDVLAGLIGALLGRVKDIKDAVLGGVYLHGLAGEIAENKGFRESLRARDIVESLGEAYKNISFC